MVESPDVKVPVAPEINPVIVAVTPVVAAISFVVPEPKVIALLSELVVVSTSAPPLMVTVPEDKFVPLTPPDATFKAPALIVVPPVYVFAPDRVNIPVPTLVNEIVEVDDPLAK